MKRRFTPTAAAASMQALPATTIVTATRRSSACVAASSLRKSRPVPILMLSGDTSENALYLSVALVARPLAPTSRPQPRQTLRRLALNLAKPEGSKSIMKGKRKRAAWDDAFLAQLLAQFSQTHMRCPWDRTSLHFQINKAWIMIP